MSDGNESAIYEERIRQIAPEVASSSLRLNRESLIMKIKRTLTETQSVVFRNHLHALTSRCDGDFGRRFISSASAARTLPASVHFV